MLFNSIEFLFCFLPLVFIVYFLINKSGFKKYSNLWLLISSLYFYAYYKIEYLPLILLSIIFNYFFSQLIQKTNHKKLFMGLAVCLNLGLLCYFKYFNFLIETFNSISPYHFNTMKILLPLGISFFTFQQIGYIYDIYKKEAKCTNFIDYSLFVSFFPQLIAGPICTFKELIPQFQDETKKSINRKNINIGFFLIVIGLAKKVLLADNFAPFIEDVVLNETMREFFTSWAFALSVALQGYFDFSGYCDIALGSALLFNIILPNNFNSPFKARNIVSFWNRWHMTLIRFLKDYILKPLGGVSSDKIKTLRNLALVGLAYGCWLGCNLSFLIYGLLNAFAIYFYILWRNFRRKKTKLCRKISNVFAVFSTFILILLTTPFVSQPKLADSFSLFK